MKERPILFSAPMVLALLAGTKTQTRRTLKSNLGNVPPTHVSACAATDDAYWVEPGGWVKCPYGRRRDRLWVRESFAQGTQPDQFFYMASRLPGHSNTLKWKPSIHMPRRASRITLEVTNVRVERLRDISEEDAKAEGVRSLFDEYECIGREQILPGGTHCSEQPFRASFEMLWESINGHGSWDENPWVWAISFNRVTP